MVAEPGARSPTIRLKILVLIIIGLAVTTAHAQRLGADTANLPDAPTPKQDFDGMPTPKQSTPMMKTIGTLGKRSVFFPELAHNKRPLDSRQKLELAIDKTVAPSRLLGSVFTAGIGQARDALPGYGQGWSGYGKRFGSSVASTASNNMFGTFLFPSLLHQDPRYFVKAQGRPGSRILYAIEHVVIARKDDGRESFNWSGLLGGIMAESLANSYLPDDERTAGKTFGRYGVRVGFSALNNVVREYWPAIFRGLRITKITPDRESDPGLVTPPTTPQ